MKKFLFGLIFLIILVIFVYCFPILNAADIINGDVNSDGKVTSTDISIIERHMLGINNLSYELTTVADLNKDNIISSSDISILERYLIGSIKVISTIKSTISPTNTSSPKVTISATITSSSSKTPVKSTVSPTTTPKQSTTIQSTPKQTATQTVIVTTKQSTNINDSKQLDGKVTIFSQGNIGDCGAVSGIQALDNSIKGKEIVSKIIELNGTDGYVLNFGTKKQIVSNEDVKNAYITGDFDARVIEAGLQNAMKVYNSCFASDVFVTITGFTKKDSRLSTQKSTMLSDMQSKCLSGDGITAACDFNLADSSKGILGSGSHSYSIKKIDKDTVIVVNPWDTSKDISLTRTWFESAIRYFTNVNFTNKTVEVFWS